MESKRKMSPVIKPRDIDLPYIKSNRINFPNSELRSLNKKLKLNSCEKTNIFGVNHHSPTKKNSYLPFIKQTNRDSIKMKIESSPDFLAITQIDLQSKFNISPKKHFYKKTKNTFQNNKRKLRSISLEQNLNSELNSSQKIDFSFKKEEKNIIPYKKKREEAQENYGEEEENDLFNEQKLEKVEKRIYQFLDKNNFLMFDPNEIKYLYFEIKKKEVVKKMKAMSESPVRDREEDNSFGKKRGFHLKLEDNLAFKRSFGKKENVEENNN